MIDIKKLRDEFDKTAAELARRGVEKERLEKEIAALEVEQKQLEADLCSGTLSVDAITEKSRRLPKLTEELDEKSMRWLELSEIES